MSQVTPEPMARVVPTTSAATVHTPLHKPSRLAWGDSDPETWFGISNTRFTSTSVGLAFGAAILLTLLFYALLLPLDGTRLTWLVEMFTLRGPVQYAIVLASFWCAVTLLLKSRKIAVQRRVLRLRLMPADPAIPLSTETAPLVMAAVRSAADDPRRFILLNRVDIALSNLRNMGHIADFEGVLQTQADADEAVIDGSYSMLRGVLWAIPVLGFIGTVQGLSAAIGGFGAVLSQTDQLQELRPALQGVAGGLATAFETTLVALVAALVIQLLMTMVRRSDETLLDDCREYCQRELVSRLRLGTAPSSSGAGRPVHSTSR